MNQPIGWTTLADLRNARRDNAPALALRARIMQARELLEVIGRALDSLDPGPECARWADVGDATHVVEQLAGVVAHLEATDEWCDRHGEQSEILRRRALGLGT